jgi:tetratricopeptide (TPR) repeat protein/outer membrane protein assembly factor BamB
MGLNGDLDTFGLATIFQTLAANHQSGTLHVYDNHTDRFLVFSQGSIRSVSSGKRYNISLGEILIARGKLDENTLAQALTLQAGSHEPLGRLLVQNELCPQQDIDDALRFQMEEEIYDLFIWRGAKFDFDESRTGNTLVGPEFRVSQVRINTSGLILEAMRRIDEWGRLSAVLSSFEIIPLIPSRSQTEEFLSSLSHDEKRIVAFVDGVNTLESITRKSCLGRYAVSKLMARLFQSGDARECTPEEMRETAEKLSLQGETAAATPLYRRLAELFPDDPDIRRTLASSLEALQEKDEAAQVYGNLAEILCARQAFTEAADCGQRALELLPEDLALAERQGRLLILAERLKEAETLWLNLLRRFADSGRSRRAQELLAEILQDLPATEDLRRLQARLLLEQGDHKAAVACYEKLAQEQLAAGRKADAIRTLRDIVRIDSTRKDLEERLKKLQMTEAEVRKHGKTVKFAIALAACVALALILATASAVIGRQKIKNALGEAGVLERAADTSSDAGGKLRNLEAAAALLQEAEPVMPLLLGELEDSRFKEEKRLLLLLKESREQWEKLLRNQQAVLANWELLKEKNSEETALALQSLQQLAASESKTEFTEKAGVLLAEWNSVRNVRRGAVSELLAKIGNRSLEPEQRFAAYETLAAKFPDALSRRAPEGSLGLTLPVMLEVVSSTGSQLPARVRSEGREQNTPGLVEMPLDPEIPVALHYRGFGDKNALTVLSPEERLKSNLKIVLARAVRWRFQTRGAVECRPLIAPDRKSAIVGTRAGEIFSIEIATGIATKIADQPAEIFTLPPFTSKDRIYVPSQKGGCFAFSADKSSLWQQPGGIAGTGADTLFASATGLQTPDANGDILLFCSRSSPPIFALGTLSGALLWPKSELSREILAEKIGVPVTPALHVVSSNQIITLSSDGKIHLLLPDGTYVGGKALTEGNIEGKPLFYFDLQGKLKLLMGEEGKGISQFEIDPANPLEGKKQWLCADYREEALRSPFLVTKDGIFAGFSSGRVARISSEGTVSIQWSAQGLPGSVSSLAAIPGQTPQTGKLLVGCLGSGKAGNVLLALNFTDKGIDSNISWSLELGQNTSPLSEIALAENGVTSILIASGRTVYCLEDDN